MPNIDPELWQAHRVDTKSNNPNWVNPDCQKLMALSHVAHVDLALEIVRCGKLNAGLVYDESTLNSSRIAVTWLSPNDWSNAGGSRYGNVQFIFDWKSICQGMRAYRIEVQEYTPPAFRILLTEEDLGPGFVPYDAARDDGPWRYHADEDSHYWNGNICLEIMYKSSLPFERCQAVRFCKHHLQRCCINPGNCPEGGLDAKTGGARFVAGLVARNLPVANLKLTTQTDGVREATQDLRDAWTGIALGITSKDIQYRGVMDRHAPEVRAVAWSMLAAFSTGRTDETWTLAGLFGGRQEARDACRSVLATHFGINAEVAQAGFI